MQVQNTLFKVEFKQRELDGKWMKMGQVIDTDNIYRYKDSLGREQKVIHMKWIVLDVYDYEIEIID